MEKGPRSAGAFLGPNGAGQAATIRHLMDFLRPQAGGCRIDGMGCWRDRAHIRRERGCIPGETAFFDGMTGEGSLRFLEKYRGRAGAGVFCKKGLNIRIKNEEGLRQAPAGAPPFALHKKTPERRSVREPGAGNRGRTCTPKYQILSLARLPIPPYPHTNSVYQPRRGLSIGKGEPPPL